MKIFFHILPSLSQSLIRSLVITVFIFSMLLSACDSPTPAPVSPVLGMPDGTDGLPWWNDTVFYQIFVRSFYDSDGDGIGDFNGIIQKLDYLNDGDPKTNSDLGVTGIWLMPIFPSPSYHGYDVTDYYNVNPEYGTMDDFDRLLEEAHKRGIRILIDLVINHTSIRHPWFIESKDPASPKRDWYIWTDEKPAFSGPWGQQVWYRLQEAYYYAVFWEGMPDLNLANPETAKEIENIARFWLEAGVDGYRLDGAKHIIESEEIQENTDATHAFWKGFRQVYKEANPNALAVGEVWSGTDEVKRYLEGDELDLAFEFDLAGTILDSVANNNPFKAKTALNKLNRSFDSPVFATFLANHDQNRVMNRFPLNEKQGWLAASILLTAPGVPFLYYGEEIGMTGVKPDENIRTPMQWDSTDKAGFTTSSRPWRQVNRDYMDRNVAAMAADPASLLNHYRNLIQLRSLHAALRVGGYFEVETDQRNTMAFLRSSQEESILVVFNFDDDPVSELGLEMRAGPLEGDYTMVPLYNGTTLYAGEPPPPISFEAGGAVSDYQLLGEAGEIEGQGVRIYQLTP